MRAALQGDAFGFVDVAAVVSEAGAKIGEHSWHPAVNRPIAGAWTSLTWLKAAHAKAG